MSHPRGRHSAPGAPLGSESEGTFCPGKARSRALEAGWPRRSGAAGAENFLDATGMNVSIPSCPTANVRTPGQECGGVRHRARGSAARVYSSTEAWLPRPEGPFAGNWGEQLTLDFVLNKCNSVIDLLQVDFDLKRKTSVGKKQHLIV